LLELIVKTPESLNLQLDEKQNKEIYKELLRLKRKEKLFGVSLGCEGFLHSKHFSFSKKEKKKKQPSKEPFLSLACYEPWYYMQIIYDGRVSPCCACFPSDNSEKITNHSLQQLWMGKHLSKVREDILKNELSTQCKQCSSWQTERTLNIRKELMMALS
jgi:MoaA/NifB/PqqE/SkfB family radical SAM enzyme